MDIIDQQIERFQRLDIWDLTLDLLVENSELIVQMNKDQLFKGQTSKGEKISPNYLDDPYFPNEKWKSGKQYAAFKKRLNTKFSTNPHYDEKGSSTPDFFITGRLVHDMLVAFSDGKEIIIEPKSEASSFDSKYKNIYGLNEENLGRIREIIYPKLMDKIKQKLGYA